MKTKRRYTRQASRILHYTWAPPTQVQEDPDLNHRCTTESLSLYCTCDSVTPAVCFDTGGMYANRKRNRAPATRLLEDDKLSSNRAAREQKYYNTATHLPAISAGERKSVGNSRYTYSMCVQWEALGHSFGWRWKVNDAKSLICNDDTSCSRSSPISGNGTTSRAAEKITSFLSLAEGDKN